MGGEKHQSFKLLYFFTHSLPIPHHKISFIIHSIELPHNIPKSSFQRDLDFYGLVPKEGEITERCFADEIAYSRQERDVAKNHLNDAQSKYEMHVFAAEVYHQYILKKRKDEEVVEISVRLIRRDNEEIDKDRSGYLSETEEAIFLNSLDKYFGLRMETEKSDTRPNLKQHGYFYVTRK